MAVVPVEIQRPLDRIEAAGEFGVGPVQGIFRVDIQPPRYGRCDEQQIADLKLQRVAVRRALQYGDLVKGRLFS